MVNHITSSFLRLLPLSGVQPKKPQTSDPRLEEFEPVLCMECNYCCSMQCWHSSLHLKMENEEEGGGVEGEEEGDKLYEGLKCLGQTVGMRCVDLSLLSAVLHKSASVDPL